MTISRVQVATDTYDQADGNPTTVSATWGSATTAGNTLIAIVGKSLVAGGSSTYSAPSGWGSPVCSVDNASNCGFDVWVIEDSASRSGSETFQILGVARDSTLHLIELTSDVGTVVIDTVGSDQTGSSTTPSTGGVAPSSSQNLYRLAVKVNRNNNTQTSHTNSFTEFNEIQSPNSTAGNRVNTSPAERIHSDGSSLSCSATLSTSRPWAAAQIIFVEEAPAAGDLPAATATDTAQAVTGAKAGATPVATTTDAAQAFAGAKAAALPVSTALETAQALAGTKVGAAPVAGTTDTAQTIAGAKTGLLPVVTDTVTARTLTGAITGALPTTTETTVAVELAGTSALVGTLPTVVDTVTAQPFAGTKTAPLHTAPAADTAQEPSGRKTTALPPTATTATAAVITGTKSGLLEVVVDLVTPIPFTAAKAGTLPTATETTVAPDFTSPQQGATHGVARIRHATSPGASLPPTASPTAAIATQSGPRAAVR